MTPQSLIHFLEALCWATMIFLAVTGCGAMVLRLCGLLRASIPLAAIAGLSILVCLGGCLNLFHAISLPVRLAIVAIGIFAFIVLRPAFVPPSRNEARPSQLYPASPWTRPVCIRSGTGLPRPVRRERSHPLLPSERRRLQLLPCCSSQNGRAAAVCARPLQ